MEAGLDVRVERGALSGGDPRLEGGLKRLDGGSEVLHWWVVVLLVLVLELAEVCGGVVEGRRRRCREVR